METLTHGAERYSQSPRDRGQSIKYTFHNWRRGPLVLTSKVTILVFDIAKMRMYSFADGEVLIHKIICVVSNETQGRVILWVRLAGEDHRMDVSEVPLRVWKRCFHLLQPYPEIFRRFLYYCWYATTF